MHPVAVAHAELRGVGARQLELLAAAQGRRVAAGLHAGVERVEAAAGRQAQRELRRQRLGRRLVVDGVEHGLRALDRVLPQAPVEERRLELVLGVARPLDAAELLEALVAHARVVRRQRAQLVPDVLGRAVVPLMAHAGRRGRRGCAMSSRAWPGGSSALRTRWTRRSLFVTVPSRLAPARRGGQDDVGELRGLRQEDVLHDDVLEAVEQVLDVVGVGVGLDRVLAEDEHRRQLAAIDRVEHLGHVPAVLAAGSSRPRRASNFATASGSVSRSWKPGRRFGIAPMSPPPCTLFWPRSGLSPEP